MRIITLSLLLIGSFQILAQDDFNINTNNIEIVRDEYGIPHIFTKTDVEAVYGLAWANCEDNFNIIQKSLAAVKGKYGALVGVEGAAVDYVVQSLELNTHVERRYEMDITPRMDSMLQAHAAALNKYAKLHSKEVLHKKLFPVNKIDLLCAYLFNQAASIGIFFDIEQLFAGELRKTPFTKYQRGSNAMAYNPNITVDGKTYLVGNPHMPSNDIGNFWEASVHSEEGYEIFGACLSTGAITPIFGTNRNLGWTHTINHHNFCDVFQLEMHPNKKNTYKYDGKWLELEKYIAKFKVKIGPLKIPVRKAYFISEYGTTYKTKDGYFSIKPNIYFNLKAPEQWYKMGKAKNFEEFKQALNLQGIIGTTITYADKDGNIYHLSSGNHPKRNPDFDWWNIMTGNTSDNNWNTDYLYPIEKLPQILNPKSGFVFNCNNSVFNITVPKENLKPGSFPESFCLLESDTQRAKTFSELIKQYKQVSFEDVRTIRESVYVNKNDLSNRYCINCDSIPIILAKYPELKACKKIFDKWNGSFDIKNKQAALMTIFINELGGTVTTNNERTVAEDEIVDAFLFAQKFLLKHYGTLEIELGKIQKAIRQDVEFPMYGSIWTLANNDIDINKKKLVSGAGDTYIFYAKYDKGGLEELETINAYGNSNKKNHPHATDQTHKYVNMETRKATLNLDSLKLKGNMYHPK